MTSLIRLRQRLDAERNWAIAIIVIGAALTVLAIVGTLDEASLFSAGYGVLGLAQATLGAFRLRSARRDLATFESEHGVGAGKQQSIR